MFKRFMIGLVLGAGAMHWYIHSSAPAIARARAWLKGSASKYSGQETHKAARDVLDSRGNR